MWKAGLGAIAALAIAGSSLAYAQQRPGGADDGQRSGLSTEDRAAYADARLAALRAGLKLTPEQEKIWPSVEQALRDLAKQRQDRRAERREARGQSQETTDMIERLRKMSDNLGERATGLRRLADAAQPLYQSLDDGQKRRLRVLMRTMRQRHAFMERHRDRGDRGPRRHRDERRDRDDRK